jgi:hypothetical protein
MTAAWGDQGEGAGVEAVALSVAGALRLCPAVELPWAALPGAWYAPVVDLLAPAPVRFCSAGGVATWGFVMLAVLLAVESLPAAVLVLVAFLAPAGCG